MKLSLSFLFALLVPLVSAMGKMDSDSDSSRSLLRGGSRSMTLTIVNQSFNQPFSPFFVMVHNEDAPPLYTQGQPASPQLALLAEDGNPDDLVTMYEGMQGVSSVFKFMTDAPYVGGETLEIEVEVSREFPLVTIASMAINTNDAFVALNGVKVFNGIVLEVPALDAGSEENNENCNSIPGPACAESPNTGNERSLNGEDFVHVHRGFFGIGGELAADRYDWRNPMMRVSVSRNPN